MGGVKANFTKRVYDMSLSFTVHSLLVADALQTFGPDYELLIASHKNIWSVTLTLWENIYQKEDPSQILQFHFRMKIHDYIRLSETDVWNVISVT